jgi:hypothetical protein
MKYLLYTLALSIIMISASAQRPQERRPRLNEQNKQQAFRNEGNRPNRSRIEMFKIKFITEQLALTTEEAEKFWPIYNEYKNSMRAILKDKKDNELEMQEAALVVRKKMATALKAVLKTDARINEALKVDKEFLKKVRNEMMRRRGGPPPRKA